VLDNSSPNAFDVLGLYNSAGHFYTTYLVARSAGLGDDAAFKLAYWSQYTDQDLMYNATSNFLNLDWDIGKHLHSLTGGDPVKLR
jgi:hypothetical protein